MKAGLLTALRAMTLTAVALSAVGGPAQADPLEQLRRKAEQVLREIPASGRPRPSGIPRETDSPNGGSAASASRPRESEHYLPLRTVAAADGIVPVELPLLDGTPVIGYSAYLHSVRRAEIALQDGLWRGDANAVRWLVLMHLAQQPEALDDSRFARRVATLFLPPSVWDDYLSCVSQPDDSRAPNCATQLEWGRGKSYRSVGDADSFAWSGKVRDWKGRNEVERARSQRAFVDTYRPILASPATALPQEIIVLARSRLAQDYSTHERAFAILPDTWMGVTRSGLPIAGGYCATTTLKWPNALPVAPEHAENLLDRLENRQVHWGLRLRLTRVDGTSAVGLVRPPVVHQVGDCKVAAEVVELALYADPALSQKLHVFNARTGLKAAAPGGLPLAAAQPRPALFDDGRAIAHSDGLSLPFARR